MDLYSFVINNKELFKLIYSLFIILVCIIIVIRTNKLFHLSMHAGIRYFRNAFFFYGLAFFSRYILGFFIGNSTANILFEFFVVVAGFFLVFSLLWKKLESKKGVPASLFNSRFLIFYLMAIIITALDCIWGAMYFLFFSQIILFFIASIISLKKFLHRKNSAKFSGFHFIAMVIMLGAWILNSLTPKMFLWNSATLINIYLLNAVFFLVFLFGVIKISRK